MGIELFMENGLVFTRLFQENFFNLQSVMQLVNYATEPETVFLLLVAIYWGFNRHLGSRYLYLWGLMLVIFSVCQHALQIPAPFWFDSSILLEETGSFSAPNLNIAVSLLLVLPFSKYIRADLVLIVFLLIAVVAGLSQIYLGIAGIFDVVFGLLLGAGLIGIWHIWNRRFGKTFAQRILGQRFWSAILLPILLGAGYLLLINWVKRIGYTGPADVDAVFYWRAWQTGAINSLNSIAILLGLGMGITYETSRVSFQPAGSFARSILNCLIGFAVLGGVTYALTSMIPIAEVYGSSRTVDYAFLFMKCTTIAMVSTYFNPWLFTLIGSAETNLSDTPDISLNKFA